MAISREELYKALGGKLKPIREGIDVIKKQLDGISTRIDDLATRIEEIEKILKSMKVKVPQS